MTKQLTTQNATITTAAVEVKTLTIGTRQVTKSIFGQLRSERLINHEGAFRGVPWGYVNHCPQRKVWSPSIGGLVPCDGERHLHVVWQKGDVLRRDRCTPPPGWWPRFCPDAADYFVQAAYCTNGHKLPDWARSTYSGGCAEVTFTLDGMVCISDPPLSPRREMDDHDCCAGEVEKARPGLAAAIAEEKQRRVRQKEAWEVLTCLPQLFIAG